MKISYLKCKFIFNNLYKDVVLLSIKIIKTICYVNFFYFPELIFTTIPIDADRKFNEAVSGL